MSIFGGGGGGWRSSVAPIFGEEWQEVEGGSGPGLGDVGSNQLRSTSTIVLHTPVPLSLTLTEEKGDTPSLTQTQACIKWFLSCASKRKLFVNYTKTMTQCMPLTWVKSN